MSEYMKSAFESVQPIWALLLGAVMYVMFPEQAYLAGSFASVWKLIE